MANVLLGVTGSVAAVLTPAVYKQLKNAGHAVKVVATQASLYFFDPASLDDRRLAKPERNSDIVVLDQDEWPGLDRAHRYQPGDPVVHIELRRWADVLVIAPLDANTLAKLASGLADNCLTCVWRAWDPARPVVLAPAMNTLMWQHPLTRRHLEQLAADFAAVTPPRDLDLDGFVAWLNRASARLRVVPPQSKRLACGDVGVGAMADAEGILEAVSLLTRGDEIRRAEANGLVAAHVPSGPNDISAR
jgi:phosphopantothenoylcysteine decarboxylase